MSNFYTDNKHIKFHLDHPMMKKIISLRERDYVEKETFDYAPIDFEDAIDSYEKVLEIVGDIAGNIVAENEESLYRIWFAGAHGI